MNNLAVSESLMSLEQFVPREPKTIVVFRKFNEGGHEIIAMFPEEEYYHYESSYKQSYMHIGQHGACDIGLLHSGTKEATPEEYKDLADELTNSIGYNLDIQQNYQYTN